MGQPANGVAFAAAGRVFDQVIMPDALTACSLDQETDGLELVIARENHGFFYELPALLIALLFDLEMEKAGQQVKQAVPLQDLFPQIRGAIRPPVWVGRIARAALMSFVQRQKMRGLAGQAGGHPHFLGIHRKMDQGASFECKDRLARVAVCPVLLFGLFYGLAAEGVLEFKRGNGNAIQAEGHIERKRRMTVAEMELAAQADTIGGIARFQVGVEPVGSLEIGHAQISAITFETMTQGMQRAIGIQPFTQIGQDLSRGIFGVQGFQLAPLFGLGVPDKTDNLIRENRPPPVKPARDVAVAVSQQMGLNNAFKGGFAVGRWGHAGVLFVGSISV